jgi:hypothetical protein
MDGAGEGVPTRIDYYSIRLFTKTLSPRRWRGLSPLSLWAGGAYVATPFVAMYAPIVDSRVAYMPTTTVGTYAPHAGSPAWAEAEAA